MAPTNAASNLGPRFAKRNRSDKRQAARLRRAANYHKRICSNLPPGDRIRKRSQKEMFQKIRCVATLAPYKYMNLVWQCHTGTPAHQLATVPLFYSFPQTLVDVLEAELWARPCFLNREAHRRWSRWHRNCTGYLWDYWGILICETCAVITVHKANKWNNTGQFICKNTIVACCAWGRCREFPERATQKHPTSPVRRGVNHQPINEFSTAATKSHHSAGPGAQVHLPSLWPVQQWFRRYHRPGIQIASVVSSCAIAFCYQLVTWLLDGHSNPPTFESLHNSTGSCRHELSGPPGV